MLGHPIYVNDLGVTPVIVSKIKTTISALSLVLAGAARPCHCTISRGKESEYQSHTPTAGSLPTGHNHFPTVSELWQPQTAGVLLISHFTFDTARGRITWSAIKVRFFSPDISHLKIGDQCKQVIQDLSVLQLPRFTTGPLGLRMA